MPLVPVDVPQPVFKAKSTTVKPWTMKGARAKFSTRAKRRAQAEFGNYTSKPAERMNPAQGYGNKFGEPSGNTKGNLNEIRSNKIVAGVTGASFGLSAATTAGALGLNNKNEQARREQASYARMRSKARKQGVIKEFSKARMPKNQPTHLITDVGTRGQKAKKKVISNMEARPWRLWGQNVLTSQVRPQRKVYGGAAVVGAGAGAGATVLGSKHLDKEIASYKNKKANLKAKMDGVSKAKPLMSDAEMKRRKKLQGHISRTTSTLGLTGLGLTGAAALAAKKPGALKKIQKVPGMKNASPEKIKNAALNTSLVSGGIGGVGGYNFAAYTNAESRKRVKKSMISKDWSPVASKFDSERSRERRNKAYSTAALGAAGATGAAAGVKGTDAALTLRRSKNVRPKNVPAGPLTPGQARWAKGQGTMMRAKAARSGKTAAGLAAGSAALAGAGAVLEHKRRNSWAVSKAGEMTQCRRSNAEKVKKNLSTSAFGIEH